MNRRRILLTGATGNWGRATLREFSHRADEFTVVAFTLPGRRDRDILAGFADMPNLEVVEGDLASYADVARAISDVDVVLHVGAVVSPLADQQPDLAWKVNTHSIQNIVRAVRALPDPAAVAVVGVGSVAETGNRPVPHHWGRVGDPIRVSRFDEYGQTKVVAEKILVESQLPRWAWLRQSGIFHPGVLGIRDAIMTHPPLDGVLEWATDADSARLLAGVAAADVPDEFWGGIYNVGSGEPWRLTNWEFQELIGRAMGVRDIRSWYDRAWFATQNFHGQWYTDSDRLQDLIPFREDTVEGAMQRILAEAPDNVRRAGSVPGWIIKNLVVRPQILGARGTLGAVWHRRRDAISAHYGSVENYESIGNWDSFVPATPSRIPSFLDHGYDEEKPPARWDNGDLRGAAAFRGGELLGSMAKAGDIGTPLVWRCAFDHIFAASPRLILTAGHWCPDCTRDSAGYARQAERNPFLAQVETSARSCPSPKSSRGPLRSARVRA